MPSSSRITTCVVATLAACLAGCGQARSPDEQVVDRADRALADLERLHPRLAKAGTPGAEELAANLAAVRSGLSTLPPPPPPDAAPATASAPSEAVAPMAVRCPDEGCWRLGIQAEVAAWRVKLRGGSEIDDVGPAAVGLAACLEKAHPFAGDPNGEWSWGGELAAMRQQRTGGQFLTLVGVRPVVRFAVAVSDDIAITARPILEVGQAYVHLGSPPGGVLERADVYAGFGARVGVRARLGGGDLTAEIGWRRCMFQGSAGTIDYRVDAYGPEVAAGWGWRF